MDYTKPFRLIAEIARTQSISATAELLGIHQSSLSKYLKSVETELGVELFDRSTSPITLTEAGKCYLTAAQKMIDVDTQLRKQLFDIQSKSVVIKVGISPSRAPYILPAIMKDVSKRLPEIQVHVMEGTTADMNLALLHGELDLMLSLADEDTKAFEKVDLFCETVLLAIPKRSKSISFEEVLNSMNVISSGKGQLLTDLLNSMPVHQSTVECQNIITSLSLVRAGVGVTLVPSYMASFGNEKEIEFLEIPPEYPIATRREVCLFYRKGQFLSSAEKAFIECAKRTTQK